VPIVSLFHQIVYGLHFDLEPRLVSVSCSNKANRPANALTIAENQASNPEKSRIFRNAVLHPSFVQVGM
jgi:hypothetical protein